MVATAIASVASFSVVLAESFAAVGLSTVMPNLFIAATKAAKGVAGGNAAASPELLRKLRALHDAMHPATGAVDPAAVTAATAAVDNAYGAAGSPVPSNGPADQMGAMFSADNPAAKALTVVKNAASAIDHLDVLVPTKATIDAEFEFHASERYSAEATVGAAIEMVTIKAGFSALYESSSRNKVTLHVEFGLVGVDL